MIDQAIEGIVARALDGDRHALEEIVRAIQDDVYHLAMRMLAGRSDAEDATQEILVQVITHLGQWRKEASFRTWVWRIAARHILRMKKAPAEEATDWAAMEMLIHEGDTNPPQPQLSAAELAVLEDELRLACTEGMLLCLDRDDRLAWILAEVFELGSEHAAEVLEIEASAFRKRLQRSRERLGAWMNQHCGLANALNACRCRRQVPVGLKYGAIDPANLQFARHAEAAPSRRVRLAVLGAIADEVERARATLCDCPDYAAPDTMAPRLRALIESGQVHIFH